MNNHLTPSMWGIALLVLLSNIFFVDHANAVGTGHVYCGSEPCIEPLRTSCEEMINTYHFQGSCCAMQKIPGTGGCRITVGFGNCFWYPICGRCEVDSEDYDRDRCNIIFEADVVEKMCPRYDFDPLEIQKSPTWSPPSCAPSMSPTLASEKSDSSTIATGSRISLLAVVLGAAVAVV